MHNMLRNLSLFLCIILSVTVYGQPERFKKKGLWGYKGKTKNGKDTVLIPPQFEWAGDFDGRLYAKVGKGYNKKDYSCKSYAVINRKGELLCDFVYDYIHLQSRALRDEGELSPFEINTEHLANFEKNNLNGIYDLKNRKEVLPAVAKFFIEKPYSKYFDPANPDYYSVAYTSTGRLIAYQSLEGKWGLYNTEGLEILKPEQDEIKLIEPDFSNAYVLSAPPYIAIYAKDGKKGVAFSDGVVIPAAYDTIFAYSYNKTSEIYGAEIDKDSKDFRRWVVVKNDGKYGVFARNGQVIAPCTLDVPIVNPDLTTIQKKTANMV